MSSAPTPPRTPTRVSNRQSQACRIDVDIASAASPYRSRNRTLSSATSSPSQRTPNHQRNSSTQSYAYSPTTPRTPGAARRFSNTGHGETMEGESGLTLEEANAMGGGLGSLADELDGAWDDGDEQCDEDGGQDVGDDTLADELDDDNEQVTESGTDIPSGSSSPAPNKRSSTAQKPHAHRRRSSSTTQQLPSDDQTLISPSLDQRLATIEKLANTPLSPSADGVLERILSSLRDLGPQSYVENGITRYIFPLLHALLGLH